MTKKNLRHKPRVAEKAKFEYSLMGKVFNKGLDEKDKKEGLLKRLRNIETKNEEQLKANSFLKKKNLALYYHHFGVKKGLKRKNQKTL